MTTPHDVRPDDPLVRWMVARDDRPCLSHGSNVAWLGRASRPGEKWVTGLGDEPSVVARLVTGIAAAHAVDGVTVTESAFDLLPASLRSPQPGRWCFWTLDPDVVGHDSAGTVDVALDDPRIAPLLEFSDSAHVFPGDPRIVRWAGVESDGELLCVAGQATEPSGAAHLLSVCTRPDARGRGLARRACSRLIELARRDGAPMIVLEMYSANESGRRAYSSLGFVERGRYASGLLAHVLDEAAT